MHTSVEWAAHTERSFVKDMRVDLGGFDVFVAQELLYCSYIIARFKQMGRKTMTKGVKANGAVNFRRLHCFTHGLWETAFIQTVTPDNACRHNVCGELHPPLVQGIFQSL